MPAVKPDPRIPRDEMFGKIAQLFGQRSTCPRGYVGAIVVLGGRIVSSGYVGAVAGQPHCTEEACIMVGGHCVRSVHAEANCIAWAARAGTALWGATMYSTHRPCLNCAKLVVNAGIKRVVYQIPYSHVDGGEALMTDAGVKVEHHAAKP